MYAYDDMLKAQKRVVAMQKKQLNMPDKTERMIEKKVGDIGFIFDEFNILENNINQTIRDVDEFITYHGNAIKNIPTMHDISPLCRRIMSQLKKINFRDVPDDQLRELRITSKKVREAYVVLETSQYNLNHMGPNRRPRDVGAFNRLYEISTADFQSMVIYIRDRLSNVGGHNYLYGKGIEKRFL
jgi:hypothetical protein